MSLVVKPLSQRRTPSYTDQYVFPPFGCRSNRDFKGGIRGPVRRRSRSLDSCASLQPVISLIRPIISLLGRKYLPDIVRSRATPIFSQPTVIETKFRAKPRPGAEVLPVFRRLSGSIKGKISAPLPTLLAAHPCGRTRPRCHGGYLLGQIGHSLVQ